MCMKMAKYYNLDENDVLVTVGTDHIEMYKSRLSILTEERDTYSQTDAAIEHVRLTEGFKINDMNELTYLKKKRIHHLKYYAWIEL